MYRVVLCDDEQLVLDQLTNYLHQIGEEYRLELSVSLCHSGEELLDLDLKQTDVLVLDIGMSGMSGMEAARILRARGEESVIIFLTSMVQHALEGYDVHAYAFLPKPVSYEIFADNIVQVLQKISRHSGALIMLKRGQDIEYVNSRDILYIDVQDHNTRLVLPDESRTYYTKLSSVEKQLDGQGFFRCHRSFLVNHHHVQAIRQDHLVMSNGDLVPLSKYRRKDFLTDFSKHMGRRTLP